MEALRLEAEALRLDLKATKERVKALEEHGRAQTGSAGPDGKLAESGFQAQQLIELVKNRIADPALNVKGSPAAALIVKTGAEATDGDLEGAVQKLRQHPMTSRRWKYCIARSSAARTRRTSARPR